MEKVIVEKDKMKLVKVGVVEVVKYRSFDGKIFSSEKKCVKYEDNKFVPITEKIINQAIIDLGDNEKIEIKPIAEKIYLDAERIYDRSILTEVKKVLKKDNQYEIIVDGRGRASKSYFKKYNQFMKLRRR